MSVSAIIAAVVAISITWGGFAYCLKIAMKKQ